MTTQKSGKDLLMEQMHDVCPEIAQAGLFPVILSRNNRY